MSTAKDIQRLRQISGSGMMDAKRALEEADGDFERAQEILREKGLASAKKRSERHQGEGVVGHYMHIQAERPVIGVLVELASETDFVAKSADFQQVARDIAMHVAALRPTWVTKEDVPDDAIEKERRLIAAQAANEDKPEHLIEKIVDGRIGSFYQDNVLYEQKFVNSERFDGTVGDWMTQLTATLGENIGVRRFSRISVGEEAS